MANAKGAAEMKEMNIPVGVSDFEEIQKKWVLLY